MVVRDLMTPSPEVVSPETALAALANLMDRLAIRHAPVVDASGDLIGVVSHRDMVQGALRADEDTDTSEERSALEELTVADVMTYDPAIVEPEESIATAAATMLENKFGCLLVTENDKLVGILTEADFVRYLAR